MVSTFLHSSIELEPFNTLFCDFRGNMTKLESIKKECNFQNTDLHCTGDNQYFLEVYYVTLG